MGKIEGDRFVRKDTRWGWGRFRTDRVGYIGCSGCGQKVDSSEAGAGVLEVQAPPALDTTVSPLCLATQTPADVTFVAGHTLVIVSFGTADEGSAGLACAEHSLGLHTEQPGRAVVVLLARLSLSHSVHRET